MSQRKKYWLKKRIEEAEKAVARYASCELTLFERYLTLDAKMLEKTWRDSLIKLKQELTALQAKEID